MPILTRRRFIAISAAAGSLGVSVGMTRAATDVPVSRWSGTALGAGAQMILVNVPQERAAQLFADVQAEIDRLEDIFSLYRQNSALNQLNRDGRLVEPPQEFLELLSMVSSIHEATQGAFDPTVQPLWEVYARAGNQGVTPDLRELVAARRLVGWSGVRYDTHAIRFMQRGMALTLNGIAQGYVADRIADRLRHAGLSNVLVDMGEIHALGQRTDGTPWRAGVVAPKSDEIIATVKLSNRSLATSSPMGTVLDVSRGVGHILDPRTGKPGGRWQVVSVSSPTAAIADGLSTALCLLDRGDIRKAVRAFPETRVETLLG